MGAARFRLEAGMTRLNGEIAAPVGAAIHPRTDVMPGLTRHLT